MAIRKRLSLTQAQAARLMGGGDNAFSKYERGEITQSAAMNSAPLLLDAFPDGLEVLRVRDQRRAHEGRQSHDVRQQGSVR